MRLRNLLMPAASLALMGGAQAPASSLSGVYSNVGYSDETGDAGGFEVQLDADGSRPTLVFTICEGGCYGGKTWPVTISGHRIAFKVVHQWTRSDGTPWSETKQYEGTVRGDVLTLRSPQLGGLDPRLERISNPTPGQTARLGGTRD